MSESPVQLLVQFKQGLHAIYGPALRAVYLFGSYARGDWNRDSDVDVLIVLDRIERYGSEVDRTGHLSSRISHDHGTSISRVFVTARAWADDDSPFLRNARAEAVST